MYFLRLKAVPKAGTPAAKAFGGAFVNCWVDRPGLDKAEAAVRKIVVEQGWEVKEVLTAHAVARTAFEGSSDGVKYYDQAKVDKQVLVFHRWPIGETGEAGETP